MALIECTECGSEVSSKAEQCLKCGAPISPPKPPKKEKKKTGCAAWIGLFLVIGLVVGALEDDGSSSSASTPAKPAKACGDDIDCLYDKHDIEIAVGCGMAVESLALNSFKWTNKWHEKKFPYYQWKNKEQGTIVAMGDKIQFQNGFGAYINHKYYCRFNTKTGRAVKVEAEQGRF